MNNSDHKPSKIAGFSCFELMITMAITLIMMGVAATLLASSFKIRGRENQRSSALADAQRALNLMSREIGNAAMALAQMELLRGDSSALQIRVRSDLDLSGATGEAGEDIKSACAVPATLRNVADIAIAYGIGDFLVVVTDDQSIDSIG